MSRSRFLSLAMLVACLAAPPAFAYPNAEQKHVVSAGGASWTVLQDHKNPLRWYYVPATARQIEVGKGNRVRPEFALFRYQAVSPTDKSRLEDNALLFFTLNLSPEQATLDQIASAIGNLPAMKDAKAATQDIRLEEVALSDIRLKLPEARAEASALEGIGLSVPATAVQFAVHMPKVAPNMIEKLHAQPQGLRAQLDFTYAAGTPRPDGRGPVITHLAGQATGQVGLGGYSRQVQDESSIILPPGMPDRAFFKLPPVSANADIQQVAYAVEPLAPNGKPVSGMRPEITQWKLSDDPVWSDRKGNAIGFLLFPLRGLIDQAEKTGKILADYTFRVTADVASAKNRGKFANTTTLLSHGAPVAISPPPVAAIRLSPEFLDSGPGSDCEIAGVTVRLSCGGKSYNTSLRIVDPKSGSLEPAQTFLFDRACGNVTSGNGTLICKGGKRYVLPNKSVKSAQGTTLYLEKD